MKGVKTTSDFIPWSDAINVIHKLYRDKNYVMSLFISTGIMTGLRVTDLRSLHWNQLLKGGVLTITEHKTKKERQIKLNPDYVEHVKNCYVAMGIKNPGEFCFMSQKKTVISIQWFNRLLKEVKKKYKLPVKRISCHSLRKTMGRHIWESNPENAELSLLLLSEIYSHQNLQCTRRYLGLKQEEILSAYDLLSF